MIITFSLDIATAPLARQVVTIIGSISGVSPTATEIANKAAFIQSSLVKPLINKTTGTMTSIKRIKTQETELTPFSKLVFGGLLFSALAISPKSVSLPTATATPTAVPLMTLLPIKARLGSSVIEAA